MSSMIQFAEIVLKHDITAPAKIANHIAKTKAANDDNFDWQREQQLDPGYDAWIDELAMTENYRHARMPGE